ncbi:hypothetical protein [Gimesia aquarii]|uniref:Uncharacterized protein n=1 Tax=Gimesia aquarii TaxID=2527964 RepID=A0A517WTT7_9PLAN|nr:hypothetical protein [Gimesia aquarii]QDU08674.1 hypothetical protein V202x_20440 [Gimesia aquarii]
MEVKTNLKKLFLAVCFLGTAAIITGTAFSELFPKRVPTRTCGFPKNYDYQTRSYSAISVVELTEQEVIETDELNEAKNGIKQKGNIRFFHRSDQMPLVIPAVLTETDFRFQKSGAWNVSLNAHINPKRGEALTAIQQALGNQRNNLQYLKGSRFHVSINCYVRDSKNQKRKSLLASHSLPVFWVKSGKPLSKQFDETRNRNSKFQQNLYQFYDQINLVEIEFFYEE